MLLSRNLDDQRFADIVKEAEGRLPWLCPSWTDHNSHDPGITILELMAWFKETQQYEMNRVGPEMSRKLLELAGIRLYAEQAAECALLIPPEEGERAVLSRLETPDGVVFELAEEIPGQRAVLERMRIRRPDGKGTIDVTEMLSAESSFPPFAFGGEPGSTLLLEFRTRPENTLRLWFEVAEPDGVLRNAPDADTELPRTLRWELSGCGAVTPDRDETLALSRSGYVTIPLPEAWQADGDGLFCLTISQEEAGCEEQVRLVSVRTDRYRAVQTESRARAYCFAVEQQEHCTLSVRSAQAKTAETALFLRSTEGWRQVSEYGLKRERDGLTVTLNASDAAKDGEENLLLACLDPVCIRNLLFDATGRPGETFRLNLGGKQVLTRHLTLMCQTLCRDGVVRPALWHCVDDLSVCGPRDPVFLYDQKRETITVGDGAHGARIFPGSGAAMVVQELVSLCGEGNIPENAGLSFTDNGSAADNTAAKGGCNAEALSDGRGRLLRRLKETRKCVTAEDYEWQALHTPGLRVAGARALPDYDVRQKHRKVHACVSVAVLPAGEGEKPVPDQRFLRAVSRQLERSRSICIRTEAIPVRYADFTAEARLVVEQSFRQEAAEKALRKLFMPRGERIGVGVSRDEISAVLQKVSGVLQIDRVEIRGLDQNSYQNAAGDLAVMPDTIPYLSRFTISMAKNRR